MDKSLMIHISSAVSYNSTHHSLLRNEKGWNKEVFKAYIRKYDVRREVYIKPTQDFNL